MDKSKQPGINFDGIALIKENFFRLPDVPEDIDIEFNIDVKWSKQETDYATELTVLLRLLNGEEICLQLESVFLGLFSSDKDNPNMDIEQFIKNHSPGLMFPYVREHIATITQKSGVKPILIPPINILAMIKTSE